MKLRLSAILSQFHRWLSRSGMVVSVVIKVRNQCQAIIRSRLNDGIDPDQNGEYLLISLVAPEARIFIDVGANVGKWAERFAETMKQPGLGLLVEPSPEALAELNNTVSGLNCETEIINAAAGDRCDVLTFFSEPHSGETSSLVPGFSGKNACEITVPMTTIDYEISSRGLEFIDFLKIDAEGFDLKVLKGTKQALSTGRIGIVQFEYNSPWAQVNSMLAEAMCMLSEYGYEVFLLKRNGLYKIRYELYGEYYGYSNYVAVSKKYYYKISSLQNGEI